MLRVDRNMKYATFAVFEPYVSEADMARLKESAVKARYGDDGFYAMPIDDMLSAMRGDVHRLLWGDAPDSAFAVLRLRAFTEFVNSLIGDLKRMTLPPTPTMVTMQQGTLPWEFDEAVYVFLRSYFGLKGFEGADRLKIADLLLAKKDAFNAAIVERNITNHAKKGETK